MKSYIIRLSDYPNSVEWAKNAYDSGVQHGWNVEYFEGINGLNHSLDEYDLFVNPNHRKSKKSFKRPGTVGCFLSHYLLWKKSIELDESICILEHDVILKQSFPKLIFKDVIKLSSGPKAKEIYIGNWWAGAMAYCVSTAGAKKLIDFSKSTGVMPADTMLCDGIINLEFYEPINSIVTYTTDEFSFTRNLNV